MENYYFTSTVIKTGSKKHLNLERHFKTRSIYLHGLKEPPQIIYLLQDKICNYIVEKWTVP